MSSRFNIILSKYREYLYALYGWPRLITPAHCPHIYRGLIDPVNPDNGIHLIIIKSAYGAAPQVQSD